MAVNTKCPKIYRNSVLHLLKYTAILYLSRCSTDLRLLLGHSVYVMLMFDLYKAYVFTSHRGISDTQYLMPKIGKYPVFICLTLDKGFG